MSKILIGCLMAMCLSCNNEDKYWWVGVEIQRLSLRIEALEQINANKETIALCNEAMGLLKPDIVWIETRNNVVHISGTKEIPVEEVWCVINYPYDEESYHEYNGVDLKDKLKQIKVLAQQIKFMN